MRWITQEQLQIDRLASAWLIRTFVDKDAEFGFVVRGTEAVTIDDGTPFHLPGAELANFGSIVEKYGLVASEPQLADLAEIVHGADGLHSLVAFRGVPMAEAVTPGLPAETPGLQAMLQGIRSISPDDPTAIERANVVMEALFAGLKARAERATRAS